MSYMNHAYNDSAFVYGEAAAANSAPAMLAFAFNASGKLALPSAGAFCAGISLANADQVAAGGRLDIQVKDGCLWIAGEAIKRGDLLAADATGKAKKATAGQNVLAMALEDAANGKPCQVFITRTLIPAST